ncbi:hypothetical protein ACIBKY_16135 [Nonomuraea sp. NPDC050394]|uniref:hypothetical protein n=1 Tax=Nonomuraea sp. NPDC050394 TaxID=3364363 RepID=UPI0037A86E43
MNGRAWEAVRKGITRADAGEVAERVLELDEAGRREVARELPGHIAPARTAQRRLAERRRTWDWQLTQEWIEPMRVAGAGTIGGAAAVASWLYRREFARWSPASDMEPLLKVIAARPAAWQADLAVRLALRLRGSRAQADDDSAALALELLRRTGTVPPDHEPLVAAWVALPPRLPDDPLAAHLLPRMFEAEGVGRALREDRIEPPRWEWEPQHSWLRTLRDLAASGVLDREMLADGCVRRFLRGGNAADLRFFVRLHELLDPAPNPGRARDYLRLLPAAPGPIAEAALKQLRGSLDGDDAGEAVSALLFRPESKLVRAGLTWLDRLARESDGDLDHLAPALASAFLCESYPVQERTVRLAVRHAGRFTPVGAEAVREAATVLPADLLGRLSEAYGHVEPEAGLDDGFQAVALPEVERPVHEPDPFEQWLDGFVRDAPAAAGRRPPPAAVRGALMAVLNRPLSRSRLDAERTWGSVELWVEALMREAAHPGESTGQPRERLPKRRSVAAPYRMTLERCAEVLAGLRAGTLPPYLLAPPTTAAGQVGAAELVTRLEGYERAGAVALPADLQQALLRLPRAVPAEVAERAGRLTSEAGRTLARWLADRPEPRPRVLWREQRPRVVAHLEPTGLDLVDALLGGAFSARLGESMEDWHRVLPSDREALAVHLLPFASASWERPAHFSDHVSALLHQEGPGGEAVGALLAALLGERGWYMPAELAERLLLEAAATGGLPGERCGHQLGLALRAGAIRAADIRSSLESCARQGAHREVWEIMTGLLTSYLPAADERSTATHTRMLVFALDVARWAGAAGTVPVVAHLADRPRSNALVRAARVLDDHLTAREARQAS